MSVSVKLLILVVCALLFGATMIALSLRNRTVSDVASSRWGNDKKIEKTFTVAQGGILRLDADEGDITLVGTQANEVSVRITARGTEERVQRYDVTFNEDGNTVTIDGRQDRHYFQLFNSGGFEVRYEVKVPSSFNLDLHTSGGNISVSNVKGKVDGETSGGDLDLTGLDGHVKLATSGGNVTVRKSTGELFLETSGGNMTGDGVSGSIHMETSGGNIDLLDSEGKLFASTSGGNIHVAMKDNKGIDLSTSGGNLSVKLPKDVHADVTAEASGGDVSCDFPFAGKIKEGRMNGKINGGGEIIKLETSGGDITINSIE
jgi:DUF4097 and DUF4098 domain-containing protein YvlB